MMLSIVTTLYRSASHLDEFYRRAVAAGENLADHIEIVMVNDGSPDDSLDRALALHARDPRVVVVDLARNFGHHKAMMTGLSYARGDLVFLIDSDLEEEPEVLGRFVERMDQEDCDVVFGVQESRKGGIVERLGGVLYFSLIELLSDQKIPRNLITARLMKRDYVRALVRHRDREFVIAHLWAITGFLQVPLHVRKLSLSSSTYSLRQRIELAVKHVTTTSTKILYWIFYLGLFIFFASSIVILYYLIQYALTGSRVDGYTSLIVSVWFFGGLSTMILGVIGIYSANIMSETKRRPYTTVRKLHRVTYSETSSNGVQSPTNRVGSALDAPPLLPSTPSAHPPHLSVTS